MWFHFGRVIGEYPHLHKIKIKKNKNIKIVELTIYWVHSKMKKIAFTFRNILETGNILSSFNTKMGIK